MFKIRRKLQGYLVCIMEGGQYHRVINICRKRKIYLWQLRFGENGIHFLVLAADYDELLEIATMCGSRLIVKEKRGLPYFIKKYKKHCAFPAGLMLAVICIYVMSLYIWNIEITGNSYYTEETISSFLNEINAGCGSLKGTLVPSEIETEMRIRYPYVSWVSVQIVGTKLLVAMEEGVLEKEQTQEEYKDIVATADGIVASIVTRKGTALVHAGDEVKKGDMLIRGSVDIIGDDLTVIQTLETGADGDIVIRTDYPVSQRLPRTYKKKVYTGESHRHLSFDLLNHHFDIGSGEPFFENSEKVSETKKFRLTRNFYLPFIFTKATETEYIWEKARYDDAVLEHQMAVYTEEIINNIQSVGGKIIENHVSHTSDVNGGTIGGYLTIEIDNLRLANDL